MPCAFPVSATDSSADHRIFGEISVCVVICAIALAVNARTRTRHQPLCPSSKV
jgi:hypothetical protein